MEMGMVTGTGTGTGMGTETATRLRADSKLDCTLNLSTHIYSAMSLTNPHLAACVFTVYTFRGRWLVIMYRQSELRMSVCMPSVLLLCTVCWAGMTMTSCNCPKPETIVRHTRLPADHHHHHHHLWSMTTKILGELQADTVHIMQEIPRFRFPASFSISTTKSNPV